VRRLALLARFFIARRSSPEESLGVRALGVIPWLWEGPAFSFFGLVDPVIALAPPERAPGAAVPGMGFPGHDREDPLRVMTRRPTFVMFSRDLTPEPSAGPEWSQAAMAIVDAEYRLESVWLEDPANDDGGFFSYLRRVEAAGREPMAGEKSR
jgi:hypothetical protein